MSRSPTEATWGTAFNAVDVAVIAAWYAGDDSVADGAWKTTLALALFWLGKRSWSTDTACWASVPGIEKSSLVSCWRPWPMPTTATRATSHAASTHHRCRATYRPQRPSPPPAASVVTAEILRPRSTLCAACATMRALARHSDAR